MSLLFTAITSVFRINGTARALHACLSKKGNDYILDHLKRGWMLTKFLMKPPRKTPDIHTSSFLHQTSNHLPCILHFLPKHRTEDHLDVLDEGVMPIVKQFSLSYPRLQLSVARQIIVIRESRDHSHPALKLLSVL